MRIYQSSVEKLYDSKGNVTGTIRSSGFVYSNTDTISEMILKPAIILGAGLALGIYGYWGFGGDMSKLNIFEEEPIREEQTIDAIMKK